MSLRSDLAQEAERLGFVACGVATLDPNTHGQLFDAWLAKGYGGTMRYLNRQAKKRKRPAEIVPGAVRAVVVLENYYLEDPPAHSRQVRIARYARGRDYHRHFRARIDQLGAWLTTRGATIAHSYADSGPVPERELAVRAGLGWIGKNAMLLRPGVGSFFFIGSLLTDLPLEPDPPFATDHCGSCTRCLEACPTDAFAEPGVLDANKCIAYLTIEYKAEIPEPLVDQLAGWAFGCDICNEVCPWNVRFATPTDDPAYQDRGAIATDDPAFFERMDEAEFTARFGDTPLERPGLVRMRRNYANAFRSISS
ncbi:MAG: tRNA epoxyqueuosine(34) reductase QueG [Gemmatimonadales bacterium]|nr:tRNA epoxyqueuosine(34) reductase QueG [Gemmatimonadales bacterium]